MLNLMEWSDNETAGQVWSTLTPKARRSKRQRAVVLILNHGCAPRAAAYVDASLHGRNTTGRSPFSRVLVRREQACRNMNPVGALVPCRGPQRFPVSSTARTRHLCFCAIYCEPRASAPSSASPVLLRHLPGVPCFYACVHFTCVLLSKAHVSSQCQPIQRSASARVVANVCVCLFWIVACPDLT